MIAPLRHVCHASCVMVHGVVAFNAEGKETLDDYPESDAPPYRGEAARALRRIGSMDSACDSSCAEGCW